MAGNCFIDDDPPPARDVAGTPGRGRGRGDSDFRMRSPRAAVRRTPFSSTLSPEQGSQPRFIAVGNPYRGKGVSSFDLARLRVGIKPFKLHWFPRLRSTNDHAAELRRRKELFAPAAVLTGRQLAGRGRGT